MSSLFIDIESEGFTKEEYEDIVSCLNTLFSVRAGEQPLDRDFGLNYNEAVGMPLPIAENILTIEIIEKVKKYEPRVMVEEVHCEQGADGQLIPHVKFLKNEELIDDVEEDIEDIYSIDNEYDEIEYYEDELEV